MFICMRFWSLTLSIFLVFYLSRALRMSTSYSFNFFSGTVSCNIFCKHDEKAVSMMGITKFRNDDAVNHEKVWVRRLRVWDESSCEWRYSWQLSLALQSTSYIYVFIWCETQEPYTSQTKFTKTQWVLAMQNTMCLMPAIESTLTVILYRDILLYYRNDCF